MKPLHIAFPLSDPFSSPNRRFCVLEGKRLTYYAALDLGVPAKEKVRIVKIGFLQMYDPIHMVAHLLHCDLPQGFIDLTTAEQLFLEGDTIYIQTPKRLWRLQENTVSFNRVSSFPSRKRIYADLHS